MSSGLGYNKRKRERGQKTLGEERAWGTPLRRHEMGKVWNMKEAFERMVVQREGKHEKGRRHCKRKPPLLSERANQAHSAQRGTNKATKINLGTQLQPL